MDASTPTKVGRRSLMRAAMAGVRAPSSESGPPFSPPLPPRDELPAEVFVEQVSLLRRNYLQGPISQIPGEIVYAATLWNLGARQWVIAWLCVAVLWEVVDNGACYWLLRQSRELTARNAQRWATRMTFGIFVSGCIWASSAFLVALTPSIGYQMWILSALIMVSLIACTACASYLPAWISFALPILLSLLYNFTVETDLPFPSYLLTVGVMIVFGAMLMFSLNHHRVLTTSVLLNIRNRELARDNAAKKEEAERANLAKSAFLASASHDLRQPMQAIRLLVENLYGTPQSPDGRALLDQARDCVEAMASQLDFLLDISRLDAGAIQPNVKTFPLDPLLRRMEIQYGPLARAKGLVFKVSDTAIAVVSDRDLLERILQNFLSNAIRFTDQGSITLRCAEHNGKAKIEVKDSGIGIPQDQLGAVFDVLKQLGNPERDRRKGTGLGLAIVERLSKLLDHPVRVNSMQGKGSTFSVDVPIGVSPASVAFDAEQTVPLAAIMGMFVVLVEDEPTILENLGLLLSNWGCPVVGATSGAHAVSALLEHERVPDLIISDYRLPDHESGFDAIRRIRGAAQAQIPAILITGDTAPAVLEQALVLQIPLLRKPITPQVLQKAMLSMLTGARDAA
jgi:two-component system, sensor histidine kinase